MIVTKLTQSWKHGRNSGVYGTNQFIYLIIYLLSSLLNLLLAVNPNQFPLEMWCLKFTVIEWQTDLSLLSVWTPFDGKLQAMHI